jgi:hypothetical protein
LGKDLPVAVERVDVVLRDAAAKVPFEVLAVGRVAAVEVAG